MKNGHGSFSESLIIAVGLGVLAFGPAARATDGYFADGYGPKAEGRAGVSLAETDDAFGGANNPATISWTSNRFDLDLDWFDPVRAASRSGATGPAAALNGSVRSTRDNFFIPGLGLKDSISPTISLGLTIYGNGGMNSDYPKGQLNLGPGASQQNLLAGSGHLGVNLSQLLIAPTVAWQFASNQSVAVAPIVAYQQFQAYGLNSFAGLSQDPGALTDKGTDHSWGTGVRVGYQWYVTPAISLGAEYSSEVFSERFNKYRGLFAGNGSFDIPQTVGAGLAWQALDKLRLGLDYKWIDYADTAAVGNPSSNHGLLGQSSGPGFGWRSISVVKLGADVQATEHWSARTGFSYNENPVRSSDVTFNILAPAVTQYQLATGVTYSAGRHEVTLSYVHAFYNSVTGPSQFVALGKAPPGTQEEISMSQNLFSLAYGYKF